ncbi:MAG: GMC family oxidoreductase [Rhizobiales bacterium]|nr:GMC family oxidoreductase [Hyphomicrobiales bacterium]
MTVKLKEVDVVVVGMGWTGSILARELTKAGLHVVGLERGPRRTSEEDFAPPSIRDELKYAIRLALIQDAQRETVTMRHSPSETALPIRRLGAFLPGSGLGGSGVVWNGITSRFLPSDFELRGHLTQRYGRAAIPSDLAVADFGVTYAELEPFYDRFEKLCGVSGKAGNLRGRQIAGGNIFEGERSDDYPNKPLVTSKPGTLFARAAAELGYHPFPVPSANASAAYTNPEGATLNACEYCGHCDRFGCAVNAKASPNSTLHPVLLQDPNFELRDHAAVKQLVYDRAVRKVRSVRYVDVRTGAEYEQPAGLVLLCAYVFNNALLMLHSGIGAPYDPATAKGVVGKNYCYQTTSRVQVFMEDEEINPFMASGVNGMAIDDVNGDNFDHSGLGFFGGAMIFCSPASGRPIMIRPVPPGTPRWGAAWKQATAKWYNHSFFINVSGASYAHRHSHLDLDPNYRDALGRPLIRMTYDFQENDRTLVAHAAGVAVKIAQAMNPTMMTAPPAQRGSFHTVPYQSTHNTGGTIMGSDPGSSVVNRYLQSWDADNLFVMGASTFPQNAGYAPTATVAALAYWSAHAITTQYLKNQGPLVDA